mmetsp:Transcript_35460/g.58350  ORF Transcript_35460/g.58350 Transcript_35460/m.58350 type:complete len:133 (-) Transcript_35460:239-637(-)
MNTSHSFTASFLLVLIGLFSVFSFQLPYSRPEKPAACAAAPLGRGAFLESVLGGGAAAAALLAGGGPGAALAKDGKEGTKDDPKFQNCVSKCVYFCTKPKGSETKERSECIKPCKEQCATSKEQLLMGSPKQ